MALNPAIAIYDACILYPFHLRNIVVQAAVDDLVVARWTDAIHDEWMRDLVANTPSLLPERLTTTKQLMNAALPAAIVAGYERHMNRIVLPDPDDRHVVAAAIEAGASMIVTWNLRDFPASELGRRGLVCQSPDTLLVGLYEKRRELLIGSLANARRNLSRSRISASTFVGVLRDQALTNLARLMRKHIADL